MNFRLFANLLVLSVVGCSAEMPTSVPSQSHVALSPSDDGHASAVTPSLSSRAEVSADSARSPVCITSTGQTICKSQSASELIVSSTVPTRPPENSGLVFINDQPYAFRPNSILVTLRNKVELSDFLKENGLLMKEELTIENGNTSEYSFLCSFSVSPVISLDLFGDLSSKDGILGKVEFFSEQDAMLYLAALKIQADDKDVIFVGLDQQALFSGPVASPDTISS